MLKRMLPITGVAGEARSGPKAAPAPRSLWSWLASHREALWVALIVLIGALIHGYNMFGFPYFESDEGTYMAQAWAVVHLGALAPYTYWYDHAPGGWLQIAAWTLITGGFETFGSAVSSGRVLMLLMQIGSLYMVYRIARNVSGGVVAPTLAALTFALSAYGTYYHRRVLLDNIATFWMLLSITLLTERGLSLKQVWLSALALGMSILSKELTIFLVPVLAYLVWYRARGAQRSFAVLGWLAIVGALFSNYFLLATLKGELFPTGTWLGGTADHVSLLGSLVYQTGRDHDAGLLDINSTFWIAVRGWMVEEPLLLLAGSVGTLICLPLLVRRRMAGLLGLATLSLWAFLGRGGVTLPFYLVPLLPLLAINLGLAVGAIAGGLAALLGRLGRPGALLGGALQAGALLGCLAFSPLGYRNPHLEFGNDPLVLWHSRQADVIKLSSDWISQHIPPSSRMIIDQSMWMELHATPERAAAFERAHYYWKVMEDKEIRDGVFAGDWHTVDYIITTNQMLGDVGRSADTLVKEAIRHSTPVAKFDTGGWPVEVRQVHQPYLANADQVLADSWASYRAHFIEGGRVIDRSADGRTTSEGQAYAMLRAVYADDRATFDAAWGWAQANLQQPSGTLAWHWSRRPDGSDGVLDAGAAPDADEDAALALLFARKRWGDDRYQTDARHLLAGIWDRTTAEIDGKRVLVAGPWARGDATHDPVVNPSYFAPYAYRVFDEADPGRGWLQLVDSSYDILARIRADARFGGPAGLAPNWVALDAATGALRPASDFGAYANEFSYDASRLPFRIALDWLWYRDRRAQDALAGLDGPTRAFQRAGTIASAYQMDGTAASDGESISMYAGAMGGLMFAADRALPERVFAAKIMAQYHRQGDQAYWGEPNGYYDQNWAWLATALVNGKLGNIWAGKDQIF
jgi:endo-1,4-beta-D-glucanase Y